MVEITNKDIPFQRKFWANFARVSKIIFVQDHMVYKMRNFRKGGLQLKIGSKVHEGLY